MVIRMQKLHELSPSDKIGLIAGNGKLPEEVIKSCISSGRGIFVIYLQSGNEEPEYLQGIPHLKLNIGSVGKAISALRHEGVKHLVMAGGLRRPKLTELKLDAGGVKLLAKISKDKLGGDNSLLVTVIKFFEASGFSVLGVDKILRKVLVPEGLLGTVEPNKSAMADVNLGVEIARSIGNLDIGQGVVVQQGVVIGVEAIEGTDALLARCAGLKLDGAGGVLVKMKKPMQDARIDLPTIGVDTVTNAHKAGLRGIAVEAGSALILEKEKVVQLADKLGLFIVGVKAE